MLDADKIDRMRPDGIMHAAHAANDGELDIMLYDNDVIKANATGAQC